MKTIKNLITILSLVVISGNGGCQDINQQAEDSKTWFFATEMSGTLCGYMEISQRSALENGKTIFIQEAFSLREMSIMDRSVTTEVDIFYVIDSVSKKTIRSGIDLRQGNVHIEGTTTYEEGVAKQNSPENDETRVIELPEDITCENLLFFPHLLQEFVEKGTREITYQVLNEFKGAVMEKNYAFEKFDTVLLLGESYPIIVLHETIPSLGSHSRVWIRTIDGMKIRDEMTDGSHTRYLSDHRVKEMISNVNLDDVLFYRVDHVIGDFKNLSYMKVEVEINSWGEGITAESLNYKGQKFNGTVVDNHIKGIFELEPARYSGEEVPGFPMDRELPDDVKEYLEPQDFIESDDEDIREKAEEITQGSIDSWEAVVRLSMWVERNIEGALPGGGTAKGTFEQREAECGGHSRLLTAFCRSVGIPARVSIGCMYAPDHGGFFGQHAWTEIWMGGAGWIPVDATIGEVDYIDAGHIRLGEGASFAPKYMKIQDYRVESL